MSHPDAPHADGGDYVVLLRLPAAARLRVGALGLRCFPAGLYLYVGSARRNLRRRVARHLDADRPIRPRWHVDALTRAPGAEPEGAVLFPLSAGAAGRECALNRAVGRLLIAAEAGAAAVPRFGAGDCRQGCPGHLWYTPGRVRLADLAALEGLGPGVAVHAAPAPARRGPD